MEFFEINSDFWKETCSFITFNFIQVDLIQKVLPIHPKKKKKDIFDTILNHSSISQDSRTLIPSKRFITDWGADSVTLYIMQGRSQGYLW